MSGKVKFVSAQYIRNYVEETEDGKLVEHPLYVIEEEIEAEILETRKHTLKLRLPDGNVIIKKHKQVEVINDTNGSNG